MYCIHVGLTLISRCVILKISRRDGNQIDVVKTSTWIIRKIIHLQFCKISYNPIFVILHLFMNFLTVFEPKLPDEYFWVIFDRNFHFDLKKINFHAKLRFFRSFMIRFWSKRSHFGLKLGFLVIYDSLLDLYSNFWLQLSHFWSWKRRFWPKI